MPAPTRLDQILHAALPALRAYRRQLDDTIIAWAAPLTDAALAQDLSYTNILGVTTTRDLGGVLLHLFNHQTHHRGQTTTLLSQAGADVGATDLLLRVPEKFA